MRIQHVCLINRLDHYVPPPTFLFFFIFFILLQIDVIKIFIIF